MGYETKLIFVSKVSSDETNVGHFKIYATLEMHKLGSGPIMDLIQALRNSQKQKEKDLLPKIREWELMRNTLFDLLGNYSVGIRCWSKPKIDAYSQKYYAIQSELEDKLPYIYVDGDTPDYEDTHGNLLLMTDLDTLEKAIEKNQKKDDYLYYNMALDLIKTFKKNFKRNPKVILWGH